MTTTTRSAETTYTIHPLLRDRWSPRAFAPQPIPEAQIRSLFEAARWSPSAMNEQPWSFILVQQQDAEPFAKAVGTLNEGNAIWAKNAPLLVFAVAHTRWSRNDQPNAGALYDLGQAVAHLTFQAAELGLWVHQMGGFSKDAARQAFTIPDGFEPVTVLAIGELGDAALLPDGLREREQAPRQRKPLGSFVFDGQWNTSASLFD